MRPVVLAATARVSESALPRAVPAESEPTVADLAAGWGRVESEPTVSDPAAGSGRVGSEPAESEPAAVPEPACSRRAVRAAAEAAS